MLRTERGFSQEELGFRARLHRNYVGAIERGEINPTFRVLLKLCSGLGVPPSRLMRDYEWWSARSPGKTADAAGGGSDARPA